MLTNEEIIARYGNHPGQKSYDPKLPEFCIPCENCPAEEECADPCDRQYVAYDRIRNYLEQEGTSKPDPAADAPQEDKADMDILYICDRRACEVCNPDCRATKDIRHAKNFELMGRTMVEVERGTPQDYTI